MKEISKKDSDLIDKTNKAIAELVYPKWDLQKAYNYYNGVRDAELFRYLEENFGIGNPTSVEFVPLIKKHIDALVGEYLSSPIIPKVTCKDPDTVSKIYRDKELEIARNVFEFLVRKLKNRLMAFLLRGGDDTLLDTSVRDEVDKLIKNIDDNFISQYELAALYVLLYIMLSRETDLLTKLKLMLLDLLITGYTFYRVIPSPNNSNIVIDVLSPLNTFIDKNPESPYIKDSYRVVVRKWLTKTLILNTYGKDLSKEDIDSIKELWRDLFDVSHYYVRSFSNADGTPATDGINAGKEIVPGYPSGPYNTYNYKLIPVYEVEWIETDKDFVMLRYRTIRIGESIYILKGKDENVIRSVTNPSYCSLTVNGVYFVNRNSKPYSLMLACMKLLDKYDVLMFYRDNLIASSGTVGDWIDVSMLPKFLGSELPERLEKWSAYKKAGKALIDSSLEGRMGAGQAPINTFFNGFDDTVKAQAIQAIQIAIESVEATASSITGVFRERLNGIEAHDAVTNIKIGLNNSYIITKQYFLQMDLVANELLTDSLNLAKLVYKNGLKGTILLGDKYLRVFTALPEYYTLSDFDVHISTTSEVLKDLEYVKSILPDFIKSGALEPSLIFEAVTSKSLTELNLKIKKSIEAQKAENNLLTKMAQQVELLKEQLKLASDELKQYLKKDYELEKSKIQLEASKALNEDRVNWYKAETDRKFKMSLADEIKKRTEIELALLNDNNPYNDQIRNI